MDYCCVRQRGSIDCGAACLATIFKHHGVTLSLTRIYKMLGVNRRGANIDNLIRVAGELGFNARAVRGVRDDSLFTPFPVPCISHMKVIDKESFHYVVIHEITQNNIIVADPMVGLTEYTPYAFLGKDDHVSGVPKKTPILKWNGVLIFITPKHISEE